MVVHSLLADIDESSFEIDSVYDIGVSLVDEYRPFMGFAVDLGALHRLQ